MSMPQTIYDSKLVHSDDRRERSLAAHAHLMHLPQGDSLLKRLLRRMQAATTRAVAAAPRPSVPETSNNSRPPVFSK